MWPTRYWPVRYWTGRYWPKVGADDGGAGATGGTFIPTFRRRRR